MMSCSEHEPWWYRKREDACTRLWKAGKIGGYAADVMENELAGSGLTGDDTFASPLFECDNLSFPRIGAQSVDASRDIGLQIISKVKGSFPVIRETSLILM